MGYIVFTDEAGGWSDASCDVYVRSFVVFKDDDYYRLAGLMSHKAPGLALKWQKNGKNFARNHSDIAHLIFDRALVFTAFTDLEQFRNSEYKVRSSVSGLDYGDLMKDFQKPFSLDTDLMNKVDQLLFLNIYERNFIERFLAAASASIENFEISSIHLDNPQQNNRDFEALLEDIFGSSPKIEFVRDDKKYFGMGLADFAASAVHDVLTKTELRGATAFYKDYIFPHNLVGTKENPNPSYQFWKSGQKQYQDRLVEVWKSIHSTE